MRFYTSLLITLGVSLVLGLGAWFFHVSFWGTTIFSFVLLLLGFYGYNSFLIVKTQEYLAQQLAFLAQQSAPVGCAYCSAITTVPLRLDLENELACPKCGKISAVYIEYSTAQKTVPVPTNVPAKLPKEVVDELAAAALAKSKNATATISPA